MGEPFVWRQGPVEILWKAQCFQPGPVTDRNRNDGLKAA